MDYEGLSIILKALGDPKRLKIIDLLSEGELCACDILAHFDFTQPTLSHHMKLLENAGLVTVTKQGQWHHYFLNREVVDPFLKDLERMTKKTAVQKN
ncbi:ArsR/SmtB family transcription factor [Candidatus Enterococcus murrayae]|uniref:Winged helix-turn-helix transcriptional regulator n=1 Tax=Candidatus Enterococcus murrayae TaxID=2815321 RepID=A0ABS3HL70_9ENTE|nr:metalloregulator ArsR/SmtB family transcription factor [Enterococcus sp. MJM16]MBO0454194.1 winged helix-turn-helix transcriptional regulator [Enterococcus sp. MJM16]